MDLKPQMKLMNADLIKEPVEYGSHRIEYKGEDFCCWRFREDGYTL